MGVNFRFVWPCIINVGEERTNKWHRYRCLFPISLISTCFRHHYAYRQENRLYKTVCGVNLDVLAAVVWSWDTSWAHRVDVGIPLQHSQCTQLMLAWMCWLQLCGAGTWAERTVWMLVFDSNIHTVRSARVPAPQNRSQHIQANTTRGFIQSVLLTMGIMMPETCWELTNCE